MVDQLTDGPLDRHRLVDGRLDRASSRRCGCRERVQALVGIAAAPDFTDWGFTDEQKARAARTGSIERPNPDGGEPPAHDPRLLAIGRGAAAARRPDRDRLPGPADPRRCRPRRAGRRSRIRLMEQLRSADVQLNILKGGGHRLSEPHEIEAIVRTVAALAGARAMMSVACRRHRRRRRLPQPAPTSSRPRPSSAGRSRRATAASPKPPRRRSSRRRWRPTTATRPRRGCWPRPATCGSPPASRARRRWRSTGRSPGPACRPSSAARPCSTGPARPRRRTTSRPRAPSSTKPRRPSPRIRSYWYFSAALAIRELDKATAQAAIGKALSLAPTDPTILFEAGHVAHFVGDTAQGARLLGAGRAVRCQRPDRQGGARGAGLARRTGDGQDAAR